MQHRRIIKEGPIVLATAEDGSMDPRATASSGLFLGDTRFLSRFQVRLNGALPVLLGSTEEQLFQASFLLTNEPFDGVPMRSIGILQRNTLHDQSKGPPDVNVDISIVNWCSKPIELELSIEVDADFFDSFEARGVKRLKRGETLEPRVLDSSVELGYIGLDEVRRTTSINTTPVMQRFEDDKMYFPLTLEVGGSASLTLDFALKVTVMKTAPPEAQPETTSKQKPAWFDQATAISTSSAIIDAIVARSVDDLETLLTEFHEGWVPAAGLPRFAVPFGRDCLLTALETISWNPSLSRDVLRFLASRQGKEENPWNYEEPGKIMHEMHTGELARLREVPFGLFYGSVDATPLFLMLGAEYLRWTADLNLFHELKPNFDAAWTWIDKYGDIDGSGYVQYRAHTPPKARSAALTVGLFNQGWKDSSNAVVYSNGKMVRDHPVALAEVQGYLYRALEMWGQLFRAMPDSEGTRRRGDELANRAAALKERFNSEFWMPDKGYYAMALDGHHRHVDVITSNPGHCLWCRLIDESHADAMAAKLTSPEVLSSWGIRTMATNERAFNAFSYHNGSIWPFENALIATGLKKYGFVHETQRVHESMVDASGYFEYRRLPEVYCGVTKETAGVLARQPDASRPQAWSSGAIFLLLQTWLGVAPRPFQRHVDITPVLPRDLTEIIIKDMKIYDSSLSLRIVRENGSLLLDVSDNPGDLDIMIHPATRVQGHSQDPDTPAQVG
jgi:glycogen debranching enzyme